MKTNKTPSSLFFKTTLDKPLHKLSAGRSMVEMLGVLAIIGVLSVGAISGYSKAMMKYKLNKQAESMNMLFINAFDISSKIANTSTSNSAMPFGNILQQLNMLPDGITLSDRPSYLSDIFGNDIWVYAYPTLYGISYQFTSSKNDLEICRNLFNVYKENSDILYQIASQVHSQSEDNEDEISQNTFYGRNYCNASKKCIKDITLEDIDILCNSCLKESTLCRLFVTWQ